MNSREFLTVDASSFLQGLRSLFKAEKADTEVQLLRRAKVELIPKEYDNWNGGTFRYTLHIQVPPNSYELIVGNTHKCENSIEEKANKLLSPYPNNYVVQVTITPTLLGPAGYDEPLEDEFLQIASVQDDFYKSLIGEINRCFAYGLPFSLSILIRKLIENLIIDILRKKYGMTDVGLYFDSSKARFLDFSVLLKNLAEKKADFAYITPNLDQQFISKLNLYRETGNAAAHSIDARSTIDQMKQRQDELNHAVYS